MLISRRPGLRNQTGLAGSCAEFCWPTVAFSEENSSASWLSLAGNFFNRQILKYLHAFADNAAAAYANARAFEENRRLRYNWSQKMNISAVRSAPLRLKGNSGQQSNNSENAGTGGFSSPIRYNRADSGRIRYR